MRSAAESFLVDDNAMLRFHGVGIGLRYLGRKFLTNMLKFHSNKRCASVAIVSNTIEDFPEPETAVKMVILRLGIESETSSDWSRGSADLR